MISLVVLAHVSIYLGYDVTSNDTKFTLSKKIIKINYLIMVSVLYISTTASREF